VDISSAMSTLPLSVIVEPLTVKALHSPSHHTPFHQLWWTWEYMALKEFTDVMPEVEVGPPSRLLKVRLPLWSIVEPLT
jgi:hypothetical protein